MTKFRYTDLAGGPFGLGMLYSFAPSSVLKQHNENRAFYRDQSTGNGIEFYGKNLEFKGDRMTGGRIDEVRFVDEDGHNFIIGTDGDYSAATLAKYLLKDMPAFFHQIFAYKDTIAGTSGADYLIGAGNDDLIRGRGGADQIFGAAGRDVLTGGSGSDLFMFVGISKIDIVTDFDSVGGGEDQDYITTNLNVVEIRQVGAHTIIDFEGDGIMKLLNVDATTVTVADDFL